MNKQFKKFEISSVLKDCLARNELTSPLDGTNGSRESLGHMKLTYVVRRIMNIVRLPTHPERFSYIDKPHYEKVSQALQAISDVEWLALVTEVKELYEHTQMELAKEYPNRKILLQRRIKLFDASALDITHYATYMHYAVEAADISGIVEIDADILTGWCTCDPGNYGEILINHEFNIEDILLGTQLLEENSGLESDEWLVVNRSPSGLLKFNKNDINVPTEVLNHISLKKKEKVLLELFGNRWKTQNLILNTRSHGNYPDAWTPWYVRASHKLAGKLSGKKAFLTLYK